MTASNDKVMTPISKVDGQIIAEELQVDSILQGLLISNRNSVTGTYDGHGQMRIGARQKLCHLVTEA